MTRIILVRHGETIENKKKIVQGQIHGQLSRLGKTQAKLVGKRLQKTKIDIIYVSDLGRARDTAKEIIQHHKNVPVQYDARIRERSFGIFEGKNRDIIIAARKKAEKNYETFTPKNGESFAQLNKRVKSFYHWLLTHEQGKTVLLVSHGGFITALLLQLTNSPNSEFKTYHPKNTAITIIEVNGKKSRIHTLNCTKHLRSKAKG